MPGITAWVGLELIGPTAPGQTLTVESINPGILVEDGVVRYQLLPDNLVKIERGEWPFMGGRLIVQETILNFARPTAKRLTFEVVGLDAHTFIESLDFNELEASGVFDGVLPMIFDESGGRIVGGRLDSRAFTIELYEPLIIFGCNGDAQLGDRLTRCGHFPNIPFLFALPIIRR